MQVKLKSDAPDFVGVSAGNYHREFKRSAEPFELGGEEVRRLEPPDVWAGERGADLAAQREWNILQDTGFFEAVSD